MSAHGPQAVQLRDLRQGVHQERSHVEALRDALQEATAEKWPLTRLVLERFAFSNSKD